MPKITKRREGDHWRVQSDGQDTPLVILQATDRRKWGQSIQHDLCLLHEGGQIEYLMSGTVSLLLSRVQTIATACAGGVK